MASSYAARADWELYYRFKSHDQEFDYLKSLEIEEKILNVQKRLNKKLSLKSYFV
jgi:hypothetical protein